MKCEIYAAPSINCQTTFWKRNHIKVHLRIVSQREGSLETTRMSLAAAGAPYCAWNPLVMPPRGCFSHMILKWGCTLSEERRCTEGGGWWLNRGWFTSPCQKVTDPGMHTELKMVFISHSKWGEKWMAGFPYVCTSGGEDDSVPQVQPYCFFTPITQAPMPEAK